jgi:transcriptional regulator with XRE-family HTH domain
MSAELQENYGIQISATALQKWEIERETSRLPGRDKISAICKLFNVSPSFLLDEIFYSKSLVQDRISQFSDIEMLTDEDFAALLQIKNSLATRSTKQVINGQ